MTNDTIPNRAGIVETVGYIVSAYVSNNHVAAAELPAVIAAVHSAVKRLAQSEGADIADGSKIKGATEAQIQRSLTKDALVSFIDGKSYKTLKRHLATHGLTPDAYRSQFGLPADYPMVASSYSELRSSLAKSLGLGVRPGRHVRVPK